MLIERKFEALLRLKYNFAVVNGAKTKTKTNKQKKEKERITFQIIFNPCSLPKSK